MTDLLHVDEWGSGDRVVVLLHGMMGSSQSWWRIGPVLANRGLRVVSMDLPGHGRSPRDALLTMPRAVDAVIATAHAVGALSPAMAVGHSFGGTVLAAALPRLEPSVAVLVDAPTVTRGGWDSAEVLAEYVAQREARTDEQALMRSRPHYDVRTAEVEAEAARRFDPATAAAIASSQGGSWPLPAGAVLIKAQPSPYISEDEASALRDRGVEVRDIPGAAHSVWYSHFDEFIAALPEI